MSSPHDQGQIAPLLALVMVAVGLACLGLGRFGRAAVDAASARTAADAAALAGASGGEAAAREVAAENGGDVVSWEAAGRDVRVRVRVGSAVVSARAAADGAPPPSCPPPASPDHVASWACARGFTSRGAG